MIAALPSDIFEQLLDPGLAAEIGDAYLGKTRSIEYFAALCLLIELDRQFHPFYWTNVADTELGFIGLIEQTNLVPLERYDGRHFLYVANYLPRDHELLGKDMDELLDFYEPGLRRVNPRLQPRLDQAELALPRARRPAGRAAEPPRPDAAARDPGPRACCSPTRPRSTPTTAAPTTRSARARRWSRRCSPRTCSRVRGLATRLNLSRPRFRASRPRC